MPSLRTIWDCMFSPRLYKIYGNGPVERFYEPNVFEKLGDQVIHSLYVIWKIGFYTAPILVGILYHRGYFNPDGVVNLSKLVTGVGVILVVSFCCRGFSRANNPTYLRFHTVLQSAHTKLTPSIKQQLMQYDFEFRAWPVEYTCKNRIPTPKIAAESGRTGTTLYYSLTLPYRIIAYVAVHSFGIRLIYPGIIGVLQAILEQSLLMGRSRLVESFRGERFKLRTIDRNDIDAMFVDRRSSPHPGGTLAICCEGNSGFYEIGVMVTPIEAGYSVLGWNHPGFGGSTGKPYPKQEQNAMNAVVSFAIEKLGFKLENIVFFGWSIGGYTSSWAATNYPESKGVILDATFDDLLPLAVNHMPRWWEPIINIAIRQYVDLNVFEQISKYPGPVLIIRRTEDEVISLRENDLSSNRGNNLLLKLLRKRYPCIFDEPCTELLKEYLSVTTPLQDRVLLRYAVDDDVCQSLLQSYISEYSKSYPLHIGEGFAEKDRARMALFLARKYMKDYKSSHCTTLPPEMFRMPWDVHVESDYVFT